MKPPICEVCKDRFDPADGGLIRFQEDAASRAFAERAKEPGFVGHRPNTGWFCATHVDAARARAKSMTRGEALHDIEGLPEPTPIATEPTAIAAESTAEAPDLVGVDLRGGVIRPGRKQGKSQIEWQLTPIALATARQQFIELIPKLFDELGLGTPPELEVTTNRDWNPMDGAVAPDCPYVDQVRHEATGDDGRPTVSVQSDQAHWSETSISNVGANLFINVDGARVSAWVSGRGDHDACTSVTLVRPTTPAVLAALTAAFDPWLS